MFSKKRCSRCDKKISKDFDFCPYCGSPFQNKGDYGLLGKNDDMAELDKEFNNSIKMPNMTGGMGIGGNFMEKMLGSALKALEKEMRNFDEQEERINRTSQDPRNINTNFQLFINGKKVNLPNNFNGDLNNLRINHQNSQAQAENIKEKRIKQPGISEETLKKSAKLPRKEAKTKLSRFKDKVVYELDTPGLDNISNVLVSQLENSIEIKAYTDKAVYFKNLTIKLPLAKYGIIPEKGKLVMEFKA